MEQNTLLNVIKYKVYDPQLDEKVPKTNRDFQTIQRLTQKKITLKVLQLNLITYLNISWAYLQIIIYLDF